jgi:hypothetical protein
MPKGQESKKDRKKAAEAEAEARRLQAEEDASWEPDNKKDKKAKNKQSQGEDRKAQQAQKALDKKRLEEEEAESLKNIKGKGGPSDRLTRAQIEENMRKMEAKSGKNKGNVQVQRFDTVNTNRLMDADSATGVDDALKLMASMNTDDNANLKEAHKAFEERMIPALKEQSPGLKMSQYKDMCWKLWQKSPENPMNNK